MKPSVDLVIERTHPDDRMYVRQVVDRASTERASFTVEHRLMVPDGSVKYVRVVAHRATGGDPENLLFVGAVMDVTERKRAEESLREQANLLSLTHDAVLVRDMDGVIQYWNRGAEELYGWTAELAVGRVVYELLKTVFPRALEEIVEELMNTDRWEGELVQTRRDGTQVIVVSRWSLQRDQKGAPIGILVTNNDVTQRKRSERALHLQANLLEQTHDAVLVWELEGTITYWNRGAEQ